MEARPRHTHCLWPGHRRLLRNTSRLGCFGLTEMGLNPNVRQTKQAGHNTLWCSLWINLSISETVGSHGLKLCTDSKEVLKDGKQGHVSPCIPDAFQLWDQEHTRVERDLKGPSGASSQRLDPGLIININHDDSEISYVGRTWQRSKKSLMKDWLLRKVIFPHNTYNK